LNLYDLEVNLIQSKFSGLSLSLVTENVPVEPSLGYDDRDGSLLARTAFPNFHSTENSCGLLLAHNHAPYNARRTIPFGGRGGKHPSPTPRGPLI